MTASQEAAIAEAKARELQADMMREVIIPALNTLSAVDARVTSMERRQELMEGAQYSKREVRASSAAASTGTVLVLEVLKMALQFVRNEPIGSGSMLLGAAGALKWLLWS